MGAFELDRHAHILRIGGQVGQSETERVGAKFLNDVERIDSIAL